MAEELGIDALERPGRELPTTGVGTHRLAAREVHRPRHHFLDREARPEAEGRLDQCQGGASALEQPAEERIVEDLAAAGAALACGHHVRQDRGGRLESEVRNRHVGIAHPHHFHRTQREADRGDPDAVRRGSWNDEAIAAGRRGESPLQGPARAVLQLDERTGHRQPLDGVDDATADGLRMSERRQAEHKQYQQSEPPHQA